MNEWMKRDTLTAFCCREISVEIRSINSKSWHFRQINDMLRAAKRYFISIWMNTCVWTVWCMTSSRNERKLTLTECKTNKIYAPIIYAHMMVDFILDFPQNYEMCQFPNVKVILQARTRCKQIFETQAHPAKWNK